MAGVSGEPPWSSWAVRTRRTCLNVAIILVISINSYTHAIVPMSILSVTQLIHWFLMVCLRSPRPLTLVQFKKYPLPPIPPLWYYGYSPIDTWLHERRHLCGKKEMPPCPRQGFQLEEGSEHCSLTQTTQLCTIVLPNSSMAQQKAQQMSNHQDRPLLLSIYSYNNKALSLENLNY